MSRGAEIAGCERLILDGGLGTELERRGCNVRDSLWSARALLEDPATIEQVHLDYLNAGAECITTASYQISFSGFARAGLSERDAARALCESVAVARRACERFAEKNPTRRRPFVAASVGPYGATLADGSEFHGNYNCSFAELVDFHHARLQILISAQPDILACETLPSPDEARAILEALRGFADARAWFSFTCRDGLHTAHGEPIAECARALVQEAAVAAIGVNCTAPGWIASLVRELRSTTAKPIVVYPNRGQKWDAATRSWTGTAEATDLGLLAAEWYALGARWIGGCCGTTPRDTERISATLAAGDTGAAVSD